MDKIETEHGTFTNNDVPEKYRTEVEEILNS